MLSVRRHASLPVSLSSLLITSSTFWSLCCSPSFVVLVSGGAHYASLAEVFLWISLTEEPGGLVWRDGRPNDKLSAAYVSFVLISSFVVKMLCDSLVLSLGSFIKAFLHLCLHRLVFTFHFITSSFSAPRLYFLPSLTFHFPFPSSRQSSLGSNFLSSFDFSRLFFTRRLNISSWKTRVSVTDICIKVERWTIWWTCCVSQLQGQKLRLSSTRFIDGFEFTLGSTGRNLVSPSTFQTLVSSSVRPLFCFLHPSTVAPSTSPSEGRFLVTPPSCPCDARCI